MLYSGTKNYSPKHNSLLRDYISIKGNAITKPLFCIPVKRYFKLEKTIEGCFLNYNYFRNNNATN